MDLTRLESETFLLPPVYLSCTNYHLFCSADKLNIATKSFKQRSATENYVGKTGCTCN